MENTNTDTRTYMSAGEIAAKMGVTVRTIQYYDQKGLLSPTALSDGGRRLYSQKDLVRLHQILSLKQLGFSLEDIRDRLPSLETPAEVAAALENQIAEIEAEIGQLEAKRDALTKLRIEVLEMEQVDFEKYADIVINLQMKNDQYRFIKYFDKELLDYTHQRFTVDSAQSLIATFDSVRRKAEALAREGVDPSSPQAQACAQQFWDFVVSFTGGDENIMLQLVQAAQNARKGKGTLDGPDTGLEYLEKALAFLQPAEKGEGI